ncbi:hypothetical protein Tco_1039178, partial [Tanacetum coccineum]
MLRSAEYISAEKHLDNTSLLKSIAGYPNAAKFPSLLSTENQARMLTWRIIKSTRSCKKGVTSGALYPAPVGTMGSYDPFFLSDSAVADNIWIWISKTHWVRAIEIPGWTPDLDDQNDEESDSEDEECEEVFKKDFGESDEEVQGENDVSRVSDTDVEEENPKSKDGVVSSDPPGFTPRENDVENVEMDNQKDNCDGEFRESEGSQKGGSILSLMDKLVKVGQTMGYNMDGCMKNIEEIIES